jgi:cell division protein FtsI (penicillin-binding protein 3)
MSERGVKIRIGFTAAMLVLAVTGLGVRLAFLHLLTEQDIRDRIGKNRRVESTITAPRGKILDGNSDRNILALNLVMKDICADPSVIARKNADPGVIAAALSRELHTPKEDIEKKLTRPGSRFVCLRRYMPEEKADKIAELKLAGVFMEDQRMRYYPQGSFMCHVLGFVNHEGQGSAGIEQHMNRYLTGHSGHITTGVDAKRRELYLKRERFVKPIEGGNVTLTIDQNVQYMVEKAIDDTMKKHNPKGAWIIVQSVKTGEILGMASRPGYDLNDFRHSTDNQRLNRALGYVYEPGSTFKALTIGAGLNEGSITRDTIFDCEQGSWFYKGRALRDHHAYDKLTVADGVQKSSNILTAKVAVGLGEKKFYDYLRAFRMGRTTGIDLPGEEAGILHPLKKWSGISITRIAIGQGVAVTALQMLGIYGTIANDGYMMKPYLIKQVVGSDGSIIYSARPEVVARPITRKTAATMRSLLARVTEKGGTGRRAAVDGIRVAGKTGTAQKPVVGGYSDSAHFASFVGFFPADNPEVAMVVVVDDPQPRHTGGAVAAPAFGEIASQMVRYMGVTPTHQAIARR